MKVFFTGLFLALTSSVFGCDFTFEGITSSEYSQVGLVLSIVVPHLFLFLMITVPFSGYMMLFILRGNLPWFLSISIRT